jgi:FkbM family methyltransferase
MTSKNRKMPASEFAYNFLIRLMAPMQGPRLSQLWDRLWQRGLRTFSGPVQTCIHGRKVIVNYGYTYPVYTRRLRDFNAPLLELAYQTWKAKGNQIRFADVGAAIGDTVLLLYANLPEAFSGFVCVDGDAEFFHYLEQNLSHLTGGQLVLSMLSAAEESVPDLVRTHSGTASAQGNDRVNSTTLSKVLKEPVDLLKIDVDGFDGKVLAGAQDALTLYRPTVIFEWHPILCRKTDNSWKEAFEILQAAGYSRFIWFTKFGHFSHFLFQFDPATVDAMAEYCLAGVQDDWHYDVIALHDSSLVDVQALVKLEFANHRPSRF